MLGKYTEQHAREHEYKRINNVFAATVQRKRQFFFPEPEKPSFFPFPVLIYIYEIASCQLIEIPHCLRPRVESAGIRQIIGELDEIICQCFGRNVVASCLTVYSLPLVPVLLNKGGFSHLQIM